ncbi:MAG: hypothetical protein QOI79_1396 [Mycobacterium sp.]|nr:hypothetical protein [Mycobacterium sp.]
MTRPDLYDPQINLAYGELAGFFGTLIDPARARKPKDKPRVERPMPYIRDSFFAGRDFVSLAQMQGEALRWATEVYGVHKHRGLDGQTPAAVFTAIEAQALMPLPPRPFESVVYSLGRVAPDCHVKSGKALYSVPWRLIGQQVTARTAGDIVQIFHADTVVATHVLHLSGRSTNLEHYPPHKIAHTLRSVTWCRTQAEQIGPGTVAIVAELSQVNAIHRLRAIQGIIRLREKYGDTRLDAACARALTVGMDVSYCSSCNRVLGSSGRVWSCVGRVDLWWTWCPRAPTRWRWSGPGAGDGAPGCRVEVPGLGYAATAFGLDSLAPGDAEPVAGAAARGEFAGLDPVVDDADAGAETCGGVGDADLAVGVGVGGGDVVGVADPLHGLGVERRSGAGAQAGGVEQFGELGGWGGRPESGDHRHRR